MKEQGLVSKYTVAHFKPTRSSCNESEVIGYSAGPYKSAELVQRAFASVKYNLHRLELFHTDRGSEFKNRLIDQALETFGIERSLSEKGTP